MKLLRNTRPAAPCHPRRGAVLLLTLMLLIVILAIAYQIDIAVKTDARVARNDIGLTNMDLAIESVLLDVAETLRSDGESAEGGDEEEGAPLPGTEEGAAPESDPASVDSSRDEWWPPRNLEIGDIRLQVLVQDENGKYNVLAMLTEDEEEREKAYARVVRIIDLFREGTEYDVERHEAESMADAMLAHMTRRDASDLARPLLLTDDPEEEDLGLPLSLREFVALEPFEPHHFMDFRDRDGDVVHSLASFLTVWTSLSTAEERERARREELAAAAESESDGEGREEEEPSGGEAGGEGRELGGGRALGGAAATEGGQIGAGGGGESPDQPVGVTVNVNTAPPAVLFGLMDDSDVEARFWDNVIEYRNELAEDEEEDRYEDDPLLDQFGEERELYKFFGGTQDLSSIDGFLGLEPLVQAELQQILGVNSDVFTIFVRAQRSTDAQGGAFDFTDPDSQEQEEVAASSLERTVRCVVWRRGGSDGVQIVPIERWEVLRYRPYLVEDRPDRNR